MYMLDIHEKAREAIANCRNGLEAVRIVLESVKHEKAREKVISYNKFELYGEAMKLGRLDIAEMCINYCITSGKKDEMMHARNRAAFYTHVCRGKEGERAIKFILAHTKDDDEYIREHLYTVLKQWKVLPDNVLTGSKRFRNTQMLDLWPDQMEKYLPIDDVHVMQYISNCKWTYSFFDENSDLYNDVVQLRKLIKNGIKYNLMGELESMNARAKSYGHVSLNISTPVYGSLSNTALQTSVLMEEKSGTVKGAEMSRQRSRSGCGACVIL